MLTMNKLLLVLSVFINHISYFVIYCDLWLSEEIIQPLNFQMTYNKSCSHKHLHCTGKNEFCDDQNGKCKCKSHYYFDEDKQECVDCPGLGLPCMNNCCNRGNLQCISHRCLCIDDVGNFNMCHVPKTGVFMTASQIALSAALIMAIAALIMVIYRLCSKPSPRNRSDTYTISRTYTVNSSNPRNSSNFLRDSLSSMQIRILSRLRDRPPAYDHETNSTARQQQQINGSNNNNNNNRGSSSTNTTPVQISTIPTITIPEAPPPYESQRELSTTHLPPPYSEIIMNPANLSSSCHQGQNNLLSTTNQTETKLATNDNNKVDIESKINL